MAEQQVEPPESQVEASPSQNEIPAVPTEPAVESELSTHDGRSTDPQSVGASPAQPLTDQPVETSDSAPSQSEPTVAPAAVTASDQAVREDNERLRREVESLRAKVERQSHPGRWRRGVTGVLVVLCCLGILCSMLTVWTSATFLNTDSWLSIVGPIGQNPKVIQTVSTYAASEVVSLLDVQGRAAQALPPRATFLAAPLTQVVQNFTQTHIADLMNTPKFHQLWININRRVHDQLLAALRGQTNVLHISNGVVTLNLIPVIDQGLQYVQQHLPGMLSQKVKLPDPTELQVPQQAQQKLSQALGVQVPSNLGQINLFQSAQLATAQQLLRLLDVLTVLLPILTAGLILATLWISPDLRRTLLQLGIGIAVTFIIVKLATGYLNQTVVSATDNNPTAQSVVQSTLQTVLGGFDTITSWLLAGGLVLAIGAFLAGKPEWFRALYAKIKQGYLWVKDQFQKRVRHTPPDAVGAAT
jgi:hypothetical protein